MESPEKEVERRYKERRERGRVDGREEKHRRDEENMRKIEEIKEGTEGSIERLS